VESSILHHAEARGLQDSDFESDPDSKEHELDTFAAQESNTEIPDDSTSLLPGREEHHPRPREAIRDVNGFEQENSNICDDPWALFSCAQGFKLAS